MSRSTTEKVPIILLCQTRQYTHLRSFSQQNYKLHALILINVHVFKIKTSLIEKFHVIKFILKQN